MFSYQNLNNCDKGGDGEKAAGMVWFLGGAVGSSETDHFGGAGCEAAAYGPA